MASLPPELYMKQITCPVCKNTFEMAKIRQSKVKLSRRDEDFCGYYETENPTFYAVQQCCRCGYTAFESDFDKVTDQEKASVVKFITTKWNQQDHNGVRTLEEAILLHQICLLNYNVMEKKGSDIGKICLRLAWFFRMQGNEAREKQFMQFTVEQYQRAFENERLDKDPENEMTISYLLGEMNRRLGHFDKAVKWYMETLKHPMIKTKKNIETLTRDQILVAKDQRRIAKENGSLTEDDQGEEEVNA